MFGEGPGGGVGGGFTMSGINSQSVINPAKTGLVRTIQVTMIEKSRPTRLPIVIRDFPVRAAVIAPKRGN